jgi:hypothetical protein
LPYFKLFVKLIVLTVAFYLMLKQLLCETLLKDKIY